MYMLSLHNFKKSNVFATICFFLFPQNKFGGYNNITTARSGGRVGGGAVKKNLYKVDTQRHTKT